MPDVKKVRKMTNTELLNKVVGLERLVTEIYKLVTTIYGNTMILVNDKVDSSYAIVDYVEQAKASFETEKGIKPPAEKNTEELEKLKQERLEKLKGE